MKQMQALYFDLDGTLADLYGYEGWEDLLHAEDTTPYEECGVLVDVEALSNLLYEYKQAGFVIGVISWSAMNGSKEYNKRVRKAKIDWCERYFPGLFTEMHIRKYGTPKHQVCNIKNSILVDDNAEVRKAWPGTAVDANQDIVAFLGKILEILKVQNQQEHWNQATTQWQKAEQQGLFSPLFEKHYNSIVGLYMLGTTTFNPHTEEKRYWVKVGMTTNAQPRLRSYLTHSPDVYFIDWYPSDKKSVSRCESICHILLSQIADDGRTEWFKVSRDFYLDICEKGFSKLGSLD